jgi:hypothetical protein
MTNKLDQEKFTKFASHKLKLAKSFKVEGSYYGEVEVYVHKVSFRFYNYTNGNTTGIEVWFDLKFRQLSEPKSWKYKWSKQSAGRRRNEQIRHQINWIKDNDISTMCRMFGITHINVDKITESKSKKKII